MKLQRSNFQRFSITTLVIAATSVALVGFGEVKKKPVDTPAPLTVPKATCGPGDHPETGLQGQVSAALRATGFKGFNCNLELIGQSRGDGANWQTTQYSGSNGSKAKTCAYHGTASPALSAPGRQHLGVPVLDISDPSNPTPTAYLTTTSMLDPWESLKVNERRHLLTADNGQNGGGGPEIDIYDLSQDCSHPQLLASAPVGTGVDGGLVLPIKPVGHEGSISDDGLTYYIGDTTNRSYHAIDVSNPREPKLIATFDMKTLGLASHGLSISEDGNRAYVVTPGFPAPGDLGKPSATLTNGFVVLDTSEVQARVKNPQIKVVSKFLFKDGSVAQHTIPVTIKGKPYVIHVDEGGSGGIFLAGWQEACATGFPLFPMPRIVDMSDEKNPRQVSRVMLETHDPKNCDAILPDLVGLSIFTYGSHYCSVDNKRNATTLACGYFESGIRVFDIRDPLKPKEIAYFNPPAVTTISPGSQNNRTSATGRPDHCTAQIRLDAATASLQTTCQDNGFLSLKFTNGVWPFPGVTTPPGLQN